MDIDRLRESPVGALVPIAGTDVTTGRHYEHFAFVPAMLPRDLTLRSATWRRVAAAEAALGRLDQAAQQVPQPALLRRPALRREAQSTSALEGTFALFETVLTSEPEDRGSLPVAVREVLNYVVAAEEGFGWVAERPLTIGLVERLQRTLVADTPSHLRDAGRVREQQVVIGARGASITESRFIPPPPGDQLKAGLEDWLAFVRDPSDALSPVARAAMAHYQFETLHPFSDGNGRIGRLLIVLGLVRERVLREPILVVSPWFEARRTEYQDGLLAMSRSGEWDPWISFFADGVAASADTTRVRIEQLLLWQQRTKATAVTANLSGVAERVAAELIGSPITSAPKIARQHSVSPQGAMLALRRLAELGIVREENRGGRVRFVADEVLDLLSV